MVADDRPPALAFRRAEEDDHARVVAVIPEWWGLPGTESLWRLLPRLFFQHFGDTSTIVADADGQGEHRVAFSRAL